MEERPIKRQRLLNSDIMEMITLVSKEGEEYNYPISYVINLEWKEDPLSLLIHSMVEDFVDSGEIEEIENIPLMDCSSTSLRIFIEFSKLFEEEDLIEFTAPLTSNKLTDIGIHQKYVDFLDELFDNVGIKQLMKIMKDMDYIQCFSLKHLIAAFIASKIKGLGAENTEEKTEEEFLKLTKIFFKMETEEACAGEGC
jgi:hypothetical protein